MSKEKAIEFLKTAKCDVKISYQWREFCNTTPVFKDVPASIMPYLSKVVSDDLSSVHGQSASKGAKPSQPSQPSDRKGPVEGPIKLEGAVLYKDPTVKFVDTKRGNTAIANFYVEHNKTRYSFGIWGTEGERAGDNLNNGDKVTVEGVLVIKDGKFNNIDKANLLDPDFKAKEEPPYEPPDDPDNLDVPF